MKSMNGKFDMNNTIEVVYTIEYQMKRYAEAEDTTERHQVLWHAWKQNKRWLTQLLEWTLHSFPTYSYHNASHADTVLHNIERILGENRIRQLTASDCFMLLHAAYMHDIGMSISSSERAKMMEDETFIQLIEYLEREGDFDMKKAARSVMQTQYISSEEYSAQERAKKLKELFQQKLDVYYGLGQIMAEYQRNQHAEKVKERMHDWTIEADKLGNGFSVSGIPLRIFLRIADCASIHTTNGIKPILELPRSDSGYVLDMVHPRFVAVMLQLGDALDMDNDRFNPFISEFSGNFPRTSLLHLKKHQAIRQLKITPERIQIQADCDSQEVLRLVRLECEGIEEILKNASYYWANIAPKGMSGCLPTLDQNVILLEGQRVPTELVKAQFNISQIRAFRLLEGANVYGGNFVFIREIIQNAIDASKLQCWEDYIYRSKMKERKILQNNYEITEFGLNASEREIFSEIDVWEYPIELYFEIGAQVRDKDEEIVFIPFEKLTKEQEKEAKYGVRFLVRDHGTGISKEDLIKISDVGSSYEQKQHFINKMPDWLKPTGQFGIGLQSVFLVADNVTARTYTRSGEKYAITFNKVSNGSGGYINVKPLPSDEYVTFGSTFEIFLENEYKRLHADCWEAWNTDSEDADRFVSDYDKKRPLRHSQEMLTQMVLYIDSMLGENLFPIYACIKGTGCDNKQYNFIKKSVTKLVLDADVAKQGEELDKEKYISWLFKAIRPKHSIFESDEKKQLIKENNRQLIIVDIRDGIGALDCENAKLYIWNSALGVFARFGGERMLSEVSHSNLQVGRKHNREKTRIYLKGIYVQSLNMYQDSELLELIDIKGAKIGKPHISINRSEFTKEGLSYLQQKIYPVLIASAKAALVELNEQAVQQEGKYGKQYKGFEQKILQSIVDKTNKCTEEEKEKDDMLASKRDLEEIVLSAVGLSYFLRVLGKEKRPFCKRHGNQEEICKWDNLLDRIVQLRSKGTYLDEKNMIKECFDAQKKLDDYINCGMLHKMKVYQYDELERTGVESKRLELDYASLLLEKRKIAIISMRHNKYTRWFYIPLLIYEEKELQDDSEKHTNKNYYKIFQKKPQTISEEGELLVQMETWADGIFQQLGDLSIIQGLHEEYGVDSDVQYTLNYMLGNIPTVALYANDSTDGNIRINVLSAESYGSVFYNKNMKRLVLRKANRLYTNYRYKRFVTTTWRNYECISLLEVPSSVCVVNGAYIAKQQTKRILLPILGDNIGKLLNLKEQNFFKEIKKQKENCKELKRICNDMFNFYLKFENAIIMINQGEKIDSVEREIAAYLELENIWDNDKQLGFAEVRRYATGFWRELNRYLKKRILRTGRADRKNNVLSFDELMKELPKKSEFQRTLVEDYFENLGINIEKEKSLNVQVREKNWKWFLNVIFYINTYSNIDLRESIMESSEMDDFKKSLWVSDKDTADKEVQNNIISYVMKNTQDTLSEKQVRNCYENLIDDIIESVIEDEKEQETEEYPNIDALIL